MSAKQMNQKTCWSEVFQPGVILWRKAIFSMPRGQGNKSDVTRLSVRLIDETFESTERGSYIARMMWGDGIYEPEIYPGQAESMAGLVVFVKGLPDPNWTHLVVTGVSKAMRQPGLRPLMGAAIFAEFAKPYDMAGYIDFRLRYFRDGFYNQLDATYDQRLAAALNFWPPDYRVGDKRLVISGPFQDVYEYNHIIVPENEPTRVEQDQPLDKTV